MEKLKLSASEEKRVRQLLSDEELGDRRPSQFLRHLKSLTGDSLRDDEGILRQLWMRRLPTHLQTILAAQDLPLEKVADLADRIMEVSPATPLASSTSVAGISPQPITSSSSVDPFAILSQRIDQLTEQVASLTAYQRQGSRSRSRTPQSRQSRSRSPQPRTCWYHRTFKEKALHCTTPCNWQHDSFLNTNGSQ
ncbi:uncharacterized protein LOC131854737 [Achroia grisella]|uniref:uncharacterized protein LOC131854737 n=1 Tax=Achroia grisella TaxID=688607 RepID=UPI0027D1ED33|nr:uncharacterized protein LOC131854737 [Achroia grisella]